MKAKNEFITLKLNQKKFKNRIYSSREISKMIGMENHPLNQLGRLKETLSMHPDWQYQYGRSWLYVGNSRMPKQKPLKECRAPKRKEISILWGLIKIK